MSDEYMMASESKSVSVPLSIKQLMKQRVIKKKIYDVDRFEPYVLEIWESEAMTNFKFAMANGSVVEGSPRADDQEIARLCRDAARAANDDMVRYWDLDRCRRAFCAVMRRFAIRRQKDAPNS